MLLNLLTKSKTLRHLLTLVWADNQCGSTAELAEVAALGVANTHKTLKLMRQFGFVSVHSEGRKEVYSANREHPEADLLMELLKHKPAYVVSDAGDETVKAWLKELGVPLRQDDSDERMPPINTVLAKGVLLARRDPTVARALPLGFWKQRDELDVQELQDALRSLQDRHALGFFLELTAELGDDRRLAGLAEAFRNKRLTVARDFFLSPPTTTGTKLATARTPDVAKRWGFRMNMDFDAFRSLFDKFNR